MDLKKPSKNKFNEKPRTIREIKKEKRKGCTLRVESKLYDRLIELALSNDISVSYLIITLVKDYIKRDTEHADITAEISKKKNRSISISIPVGLYDEVEKRANKQLRSVNTILNIILTNETR